VVKLLHNEDMCPAC